MSKPFWTIEGQDLHLRIKVSPGASHDAVAPVWTDANGDRYLRVRVRAAPDKGQANKAVCAVLAKHYGVPKSSVTLVRGATNSMKHILISGGADLQDILRADDGSTP